MNKDNPSIGFLIASIGQKTLTNTVRSLYGQFAHGHDKIYLYFDGRCDAGFDYFKAEYALYGEDMIVTMLPKNLGYWGHGIRNEYQDLCTTDYIHHSDDDDMYADGVVPSIRNDLIEHYGKMIIYRFRHPSGAILWQTPIITGGQIGTPSGLIPNRPEIFGHWKEAYGGDASFYEETQQKIGKENIIFKDRIIYLTKPHIYGYH